jgi:hypothetical protein
MPQVTLTRQQLFERVWSTPIERLAREFNLSGRGLGKLCARHGIPVPPRGYWARKAAGQRVPQPALPEFDHPGRQTLSFDQATLRPVGERPSKPEQHPLVAFEQEATNRLSVAEDLPLVHELVLKTQRLLKRAKRDPHGLALVQPGGLHVRVSRDRYDRALRIMEALLTAFVTRGFPLAVTPEGIRVTILEVPLGFGVEEELDAVEHRTTFTEQKLIDQGRRREVPTKDYLPSGRLALVITSVRGTRQRWSERTHRPEEALNTYIVGLVRAALTTQRQRVEAERLEQQRRDDERRRQKEARQLAESQRRWREEQGKVERLDRLRELWERHRQFKTVVAELQDALGDVTPESELGRWLDWAHEQVKQSDPLRWCRHRTGRVLTLYYYGYDTRSVETDGFSESEPSSYREDKTKAGIKLTDQPPQASHYERPLRIELLEDLVLPYEWIQESNWYWRVFRPPAALLNQTLGYGAKDAGSPDGPLEDESD